MKRLTLVLMLVSTSPGLATSLESRLNGCAKFSELVVVIVEARSKHDSLETAIRTIPEMPEVQKFGFNRSVARQTILHTELLYESIAPETISEWMKLLCVEKAMQE